MASLTWRLGSRTEEQDELPVCTLCRKRKLRCSRDVPCNNCARTESECTYDAKSKPGLKTGAVEGLNRRLAVLERLLLDEKGVPFMTFDGNDRNGNPSTCHFGHHLGDGEGGLQDVPTESDYRPHERSQLPSDFALASSSRFGVEDREESDLLQALPSQHLLVQVVDFFCGSFHHWIPFLHKTRYQSLVRASQATARVGPVLHAIVAVGLPRLAMEELNLSDEAVKDQIRASYGIALQYSVTHATLESLQALMILVFAKIMDGEILQASPLVASLVRTVDFLQITSEPDMSRSNALMRPLQTLEPTTDWTELEARRRLFWCVFALDRLMSAHTGWNTSLTASDVYRRLPADGRYFALETPVTCPFFGIWNKTYAHLGSPLSTHIPAQYHEASPASATADLVTMTPVSQGSVDSSKMGAFAYSIEAIESLHQVTTFFLHQRIDWQDRKYVLDWLTRFKELDLRLIHWKMFLPPRWKDSNISEDDTRIDMDPNLTLAHLTHNTALILLHYPVAFPRSDWTGLVQLPSSCSKETCQTAAVEISRISNKFLCNTSIPFVSPQFSFCVFVAAKLLLAASHISQQQPLFEIDALLKALWDISSRWRSSSRSSRLAQHVSPPPTSTDLAGSYAAYVEKLRIQCQKDPGFRFDFYDHTGRGPKVQLTVPVAAALDGTTIQTPASHMTSNASRTEVAHNPRRQKRKAQKRTVGLRVPAADANTEINQQQTFAEPSTDPTIIVTSQQTFDKSLPTLTTMSKVATAASDQPGVVQLDTSTNVEHPNDAETWPMFDFSDSLMYSQFLEQDRVITFKDTYFQTSNMDWS